MYVESMGQARNIAPAAKPETEKVFNAQSTDGRAEYKAEEPKKNPKEAEGSEMPAIDNESVKKVIEKLNVQFPNAEAKFGIHEATNRVMITLVDKETQEVIKEIPPEKTLDMIVKRMELAGVLVDEKL